jgi:hypothetical protein
MNENTKDQIEEASGEIIESLANLKVKFDNASPVEKGGVLFGGAVLLLSLFADPLSTIATGATAVLGYKWLNRDKKGPIC